MGFVELPSFSGSRPKKRRRGHVHGRYCGKGLKGEKSRKGRKHIPILEGGQMPVVRRLPKRGFSNKKFEVRYEIVNLGAIEKKFSEWEEVNSKTLLEKGLLRKKLPVKILGSGTFSKSLVFRVDKVSATAAEKIKKASGSVALPENSQSK
ncbi:MAG: 50S ribosomal protein L15 [Elusimicrobia bacterium]|nr:50S ribosomal protein L15 [Elusimicrobiota bacterium]